MRVLLFTDSDAFAGTEAHILALAKALPRYQVESIVACPVPSPLWERCRAVKIPVHAVPRRGFVDPLAAAHLSGLLRRREVHLIHAHNGRSALHGALSTRLARRGTLVWTQHFLHPAHTTRRSMLATASRRAHHWMNQQSAGVIAISNAVAQAMLAREPEMSDRIRVILNGVEDPAGEVPAAPRDIREELQLPTGEFSLLCIARLEAEKDLPVLLESMALLRDKAPAVRLCIAGEGGARAELEAQIARLNLSRSVRLLGRRTDIPQLLRAADAFVLPSRAEPFGLAVLEAMAMARPVIAAGAGGPAEIVVPGRTGLLASPGDPTSLAEAILNLAENREMAAAMGRAGRTRFLDKFTAARMARDTANFYREVTD